MTVFPQLKTMTDLEIQAWLRKVGRENVSALGMALVGADDTVKSLVYRNMSERASSILAEDVNQYREKNLNPKTIEMNAEKLERMLGSTGNSTK